MGSLLLAHQASWDDFFKLTSLPRVSLKTGWEPQTTMLPFFQLLKSTKSLECKEIAHLLGPPTWFCPGKGNAGPLSALIPARAPAHCHPWNEASRAHCHPTASTAFPAWFLLSLLILLELIAFFFPTIHGAMASSWAQQLWRSSCSWVNTPEWMGPFTMESPGNPNTVKANNSAGT